MPDGTGRAGADSGAEAAGGRTWSERRDGEEGRHWRRRERGPGAGDHRSDSELSTRRSLIPGQLQSARRDSDGLQKQTNKQASKQTKKQTNKQTDERKRRFPLEKGWSVRCTTRQEEAARFVALMRAPEYSTRTRTRRALTCRCARARTGVCDLVRTAVAYRGGAGLADAQQLLHEAQVQALGRGPLPELKHHQQLILR